MSQPRLKAADTVTLPATFLPPFRTSIAVQNGVEKNLLVKIWGGLGDQICAEPTLRFALRTFKGCDISLAAEVPELFRHLQFKRVFDLRVEQPIWDDYLVFQTIYPPDETNLQWLFMSHMISHCVDYCSLTAFRCQLPVAEREVRLEPGPPCGLVSEHLRRRSSMVVVHPGRHWASKTFPKNWWDAVITHLVQGGAYVVLVGADTDDNRGTVDVDPAGTRDLRGKLSVLESCQLLRDAQVLLTNDSSPLHMAVPGEAWIGFFATVKHPDYITHWRRGRWGWRMQNLGSGGIWDHVSYCPNVESTVKVDEVDPALLRSWLPDPAHAAAWALSKLASSR